MRGLHNLQLGLTDARAMLYTSKAWTACLLRHNTLTSNDYIITSIEHVKQAEPAANTVFKQLSQSAFNMEAVNTWFQFPAPNDAKSMAQWQQGRCNHRKCGGHVPHFWTKNSSLQAKREENIGFTPFWPPTLKNQAPPLSSSNVLHDWPTWRSKF